MEGVDTELKDLNLSDQLRSNSSFMKIAATLFHYGNQSMNAAQLVTAVRALNLLPLRGETPKSTIQGIISTSRKQARDLKQPDPFTIHKENSGRQAKYSISDTVLNGVKVPEPLEIPDEPIILKPVESSSGSFTSSYSLGKRQRKSPKYYTPEALRKAKNRRARAAKLRRKNKEGFSGAESDSNSDVDVDMDEDLDFMSMASSDEEDSQVNTQPEEDTISGYSLLYSAPPADQDYIDPINFEDYGVASYFAIAQQKGYSYPRFRSHDKIKIPKVHCEDKFRVTDVISNATQRAIGRLFILADGHGGRGCSEYFVRNTPAAVQKLCNNYDPEKFDDKDVQKQFEKDIKRMVEEIDTEYLALKRIQLGRHQAANNNNHNDNNSNSDQQNETTTPNEELDNDGCTLILNLFFGKWLVNINVGDSRSVLISAPKPADTVQKTAEELNTHPLICGLDNDYKMDVVFASQDHKPYLEHLAREILENGGEFIDSVQDRVIRVDLDKLREDGNRQTKRVALKNARIRPKCYSSHEQQHQQQQQQQQQQQSPLLSSDSNTSTPGYAAQSAVRTTANHSPVSNTATVSNNSTPTTTNNNNGGFFKVRSRDERIPSLNVARSCGDLDFKMDPKRKIISCEPDVSFFRISDSINTDHNSKTLLTSGANKEKRRHFLLMSTDGLFDYMYEETPERQNRAVAKVLGPMIEDGEKVGHLLLEEEERVGGETIEHNPSPKNESETTTTTMNEEKMAEDKNDAQPNNNNTTSSNPNTPNAEPMAVDPVVKQEGEEQQQSETKPESSSSPPTTTTTTNTTSSSSKETEQQQQEQQSSEEQEKEPAPPLPRLFRELNEDEAKTRKIRERTLVMAARYFANRESVHGFFASTLQDYDDCTIVLIEI